MRILSDISVRPDFVGLPPSVYHGLVHLTNNAAAVLTLVAGLGLTVSLIGLVLASFTASELTERAVKISPKVLTWGPLPAFSTTASLTATLWMSRLLRPAKSGVQTVARSAA